MTIPQPVLLIVGDSAQVAQLRTELICCGLSICCAASGAAALAAGRSLRPAAIILDESLADLDGSAVCRLLRADPQTAPIPIIFLTSHNQLPAALPGLVDAVADCIAKNAFSTHNLLHALHQLGAI